jgi:uncharacterized protein
MSESKDEISELCVSCGMCCDGTLFGGANLLDEADRKIAADLGMVTFELKEKPHFKLPCHLFSSCCTIYGQERPHVCGAFFCYPIKKMTRGEQTMDETRQQVESLRDHKNKLMQAAARFPELAAMPFRELKGYLEYHSEDQEKISQYRHLFLFLLIFEDLRTKYFNVAKKDTRLAT